MRGSKVAVALACLLAGAGPLHAACSVNKFAELPVTMAGLRPMVDARINGKPVRFLADSGAFYSVISPGVAAELGLAREPARLGSYIHGIGGDADISLTTVRDFTVAGQPIRDLTFIVGGSEVGGGSAGVLGQNFLGLRDAEYDLAGGMIRLMSPHACDGHSNLAYWSRGKALSILALEPLDRNNPKIRATVVVNGIKMHAVFDTGAWSSSLSVAAAARAGVHPDDPGVRSAGYSAGIGRSTVKTWIAPFASFAVDGEEIRNTHLRVSDWHLEGVDMLVGADFFLSHHIYVSNTLHRMFLTYNGGPVFNLATQPAPADGGPAREVADAAPSSGAAGEAPSDADGLARHAAVLATRRDYAGALADLDRAVTLAPDNAELLKRRAQVHMALRQPLLASGDLDAAVRVKPEDVELRMLRASLRLRANDRAGATEDADVAANAASKSADLRLPLGLLYDDLGALPAAIHQYDLWIENHPDDSRRPSAFNDRCYARAQLGQELQRALGDCNAAIRARPNAAYYLDSRGLVRLRMGDYDHAISDYDAALAIAPKQAWSLYGRGLAKLAKGMKVQGDADVAAAVAIQPDLPAEARRLGINPPG